MRFSAAQFNLKTRLWHVCAAVLLVCTQVLAAAHAAEHLHDAGDEESVLHSCETCIQSAQLDHAAPAQTTTLPETFLLQGTQNPIGLIASSQSSVNGFLARAPPP